MAGHVVEPAGRSKAQGSRERVGVLVVAGGIISVIAVYLVVNARTGSSAAKDLLPYQTLARELPDADQQMFKALRQGLLAAETERARTAAWPDASRLASMGVAPFTSAGASAAYQWSRYEQGAIIDYFGQPRDPSAPAWLLEIQEPEPGMLPDPAPLDDEHHRLPDGTTLHTYVWMHGYGGQVPAAFTRQPQTSGWVQVFSAAPNPVFYNRR